MARSRMICGVFALFTMLIAFVPVHAVTLCHCDLTGDGRCNMRDWLLFGREWGRIDCLTSCTGCACDLNSDGRCNMRDWLLFGNQWGRTDCHLIYDPFQSMLIDSSKWDRYELVREIADGTLHMDIRGYDERATNEIWLTENDTPYYAAKVLMEGGSGVLSGAYGAVAIAGYFYNDSRNGTTIPYNGEEGNVWCDIRIGIEDDGSLIAHAFGDRYNNADGTSATRIFTTSFSTPIRYDTEYDLSIELKDTFIIFKCNEETRAFPISTPIYPSSLKLRRLMSRLYADPGEEGYVKGRFDNVRVE